MLEVYEPTPELEPEQSKIIGNEIARFCFCFENIYCNRQRISPSFACFLFKGVKGYIYSCNQITPYQNLDIKIPNAFISTQKTPVDNCEFVPDAYNEIINAEKNGLITVLRYNEFIDDVKRKEWLERVITDEYRKNKAHPDYRFFLRPRFSAIINRNV